MEGGGDSNSIVGSIGEGAVGGTGGCGWFCRIGLGSLSSILLLFRVTSIGECRLGAQSSAEPSPSVIGSKNVVPAVRSGGFVNVRFAGARAPP